jgi:hypothetical protein
LGAEQPVFGWQYEFKAEITTAPDMPVFLLPVRHAPETSSILIEQFISNVDH